MDTIQYTHKGQQRNDTESQSADDDAVLISIGFKGQGEEVGFRPRFKNVNSCGRLGDKLLGSVVYGKCRSKST